MQVGKTMSQKRNYLSGAEKRKKKLEEEKKQQDEGRFACPTKPSAQFVMDRFFFFIKRRAPFRVHSTYYELADWGRGSQVRGVGK